MEPFSSQTKRPKTLHLILKTAERCNLNCSYCYFFNKGDESYKKHPAFISEKVILALIAFLQQGVTDLNISRILVAFHGGEPTLQPVHQFERLCSLLMESFHNIEIVLGIQTNATLISEKWIQAFGKYKVHVGISLDGPKEYNDIHRVDHQNRGSYEASRRGIELLNKSIESGIIGNIGALCVIDPSRDPRKIYRHFVDELKLYKMDFLLPDMTYDDIGPTSVESYGSYLCALLDEWIRDDNPMIRIRFLESTLRVMGGKQTTLAFFGPDLDDSLALTVSSNGELSPDDTLRSANAGKLMQLGSIWNTTLKSFFETPIFQSLKKSKKHLPLLCQNCRWKNICCGGSHIHRYSKSNGFDNPSVMCVALKMLYSKVEEFLLNQGYPTPQINSTNVY